MKQKKWICLLLAAALMTALCAPALADGAPPAPVDDSVSDGWTDSENWSPLPEEELSADGEAEAPPTEESVPAGVALVLSGAVEGVEKLAYPTPEGVRQEARQDGVYTFEDADGDPVLTESADGIPTALTAAAESQITLTLAAGYTARADSGDMTAQEDGTLALLLPAEGTVTMTIEAVSETETAPETEAVPETEALPEMETTPDAEAVPEAEATPEVEGEPEAETETDEPFPPPDAATGTFKDVPDSSWYRDIVERAYASGMIAGVTADTFAPNDTASRGQTVTMLWRQAGSPAASAGAFTDLSADYYKDAVAWASYVHAVNGVTSTSFAPGSCVTREQLAAILYRMAGSPSAYSGGLVSGWADSGDVSSWARTAMQWALDYGIVNGYEDGYLRPGQAASRAEVCAMLLRYNELVGLFPTEPPTPTFEEQAISQNVSHTQRNLDNPKLIPPKRAAIDKGLYSRGDRDDPWMQQWVETYWDLDRSGEDLMWSLQNLTRMHSGPGEAYPVVYTLYATYEVSRLGPDENGWTPVVYHEYETGEGFTGWDHTGYVRTDEICDIRPSHTHVADFSSGPALWDWCRQGGVPEGDRYYDCGATANGTFYHETYAPVIDGDTYTYTLRGGGHVIIHNVLPEGLVSVEASGEEELDNVLLFVSIEKGYGFTADKGYGGGYSLSPSGDYMSCGIDWTVDMSTDEDIELTMFCGEGAPRVLKATLKDPKGGSRMGNGASRFVFLDENGSLYSEYENFFNLKSGYKLKSLSPYATVGRVENNELHHFSVKNVPAGVDQIFFEVVRK